VTGDPPLSSTLSNYNVIEKEVADTNRGWFGLSGTEAATIILE